MVGAAGEPVAAAGRTVMALLPPLLHQTLGFGTFVGGLVGGSPLAASLLSRLGAGAVADASGGRGTVLIGLVATAESLVSTGALSWGQGRGGRRAARGGRPPRDRVGRRPDQRQGRVRRTRLRAGTAIPAGARPSLSGEAHSGTTGPRSWRRWARPCCETR